MDLQKRINAFSALGEILRGAAGGTLTEDTAALIGLIERQHISNPWFTPDNVRMAVGVLGEKLTGANLKNWTDKYPSLAEKHIPFTAGVIMAGNIPLVGFHDLLSVLISGNRLIAKTSSKDTDLIKETGRLLVSQEPGFADRIIFTEGALSGFDVAIATGSDNSARYFDYYFSKYPHIIRRNRNSIAVLDGNETDNALKDLAKDVFLYFGLGCRNVSKILVPEGFDFERLISCWQEYTWLVGHPKYANNLDYNKAVYLVNRDKFFDGGFVLLRESKELASPVGVLFYEYYNHPEETENFISINKDYIQCITGRKHLPLGTSQSPELWEYSDNADTLDFLLKKNMSGIL